MPSFDVVSEIDKHEAQNAVDQANRELERRYDFKGANAQFALQDWSVTLTASDEFQVDQMKPMLEGALIKRSIKVSCLEYSDPQGAGKQVKVVATLRQGIDKDLGRKMLKLIKDSKIKVQAAIQGEMVRVTGKKRDDLQQVMALLKADESITLPLMFKNFKD
ncbi:YajQ family cyclic di-GMP-binding protein [Bacterioplanes sanyensis]|uniref:Nucleotide-binding protein CHH28_12450 n=1 Tax=Bacterioplanes sanyensis TaxID=1249553 RepID=A0A222FMI2_9GAMM|nr:YajQ family cyclic di-GMP-binding protein [Bacterioplanes sanyensis]ASP39433.1 YajQ family cyclic di-GMP-binding protein [Bacterioplanes sanyensis]